MNAPGTTADWPSAFSTVTDTGPAAAAGALQVTEFAETATLVAFAVPNLTVAPVWKPEPAIVTGVPPAAGPALGATGRAPWMRVLTGGATAATSVRSALRDAHVPQDPN